MMGKRRKIRDFLTRRHQPTAAERRAWQRDLARLVFKRRIGAAPSRGGPRRLLYPDEMRLILRARRADVDAALRTLDKVPAVPPDQGDEKPAD